MLPELDTIAQRRRALGLTQTEIAEKAKVSQSYIAKLEAKKIEPSYSKVRAILEVLDGLERGKETRAEEIMSTEIVSLQRDDVVQKAVDIMWSTGFSQLPVMDGERPVGSITERTIIDRMRYTARLDASSKSSSCCRSWVARYVSKLSSATRICELRWLRMRPHADMTLRPTRPIS